MYVDIKVSYNNELAEYDIDYSNGDLVIDKTMLTALLISLLTDRRANDDDVLLNEEDKKGWWGDLLEEGGSKIGSRLWLLKGKTDQQSLNQAKEYIKESIQWFVDDGIWQSFTVLTEKSGDPYNQRLNFQIDAHYSNGQLVSYKFKNLWENQLNIIIMT